MGIFQQFPYSNFHEFNLDQIIKIMREMQDEWEATKSEWASYKDFIDNYFANLDVSAEVLQAIQTMAASGELSPIIDPTIISETADWLAEHITQPTTPVIDDTLTIAGAAADAKAAGDAIRVVTDMTDADQFIIDTLGEEATVIEQSGSTRLVAKYYLVHENDVISFHAGTVVQDYLVEYFDYDTASYTHQKNWGAEKEYRLDSDGYINVKFRKPDDSNITVSEYDAKVSLIRNNRDLNQIISTTGEYEITTIGAADIIQGSYDRSGAVVTNYSRLRITDFIDVTAGDKVLFKAGNNAQGLMVCIVNHNANTYESSWVYTDSEITINHSGHMMLLFRRSSNADLGPVKYDAEVAVLRSRPFKTGSEKYNGNLFRVNYSDAIAYPVRTSSSYSVAYSDIIALYDSVRSRVTSNYTDVDSSVPKPVTITKTAIGTAGSYTLYKYIATPAYPKKTICIIAGTHGNEYEGIYALARMFREIYCGEYPYPQLDYLRQNVKLIIIPVVNPYGFEHNTKLNGDGENIYDQYPSTAPQSVEITAVKNTLASETIDFFMDMHTDPYVVNSKKGCYGYALTTGDMFEPLYKAIMKFRDIVYNEFNYDSKFLNASNKDTIVGLITSINAGGSVAYGERNGIPSILAEISTDYGWGGSGESGDPAQNPSFAPYGSSDMMRIAVDFYTHVLLNAYHKINE